MKRNNKRRAAFSLLEVILALSILAGAVATLGELLRTGVRNAQSARDLTRAQMLCEEIEAEVVSGVIAATAVDNTPCDDDPRWLYSLACNSDQSGILILQVTVTKDLPAAQHPASFTLWRWMIDPASRPNRTSTTNHKPLQPPTPVPQVPPAPARRQVPANEPQPFKNHGAP